MGHSVTLGGERLGGGKKNKVHLHGYERTTHDMGYVWRSTVSVGTVVPFINEVATPGDTFDINLDLDVMTLPTIGPLYGSMKLHLDVFVTPIRLYNAWLHMNKLNIGMDMSKVYLPQILFEGNVPNPGQPIDNQQIHPSSLPAYLGMRGLGYRNTTPLRRYFNATGILNYWDIIKNYYANKQEGIGVVVHTNPIPVVPTLTAAQIYEATPTGVAIPVGATAPAYTNYLLNNDSYIVLTFTPGTLTSDLQPNQIIVEYAAANPRFRPITDIFSQFTINPSNNTVIGTTRKVANTTIGKITIQATYQNFDTSPKLTKFPLTNIDDMRMKILAHNGLTPYLIASPSTGVPPTGDQPYNLMGWAYTVTVGPPSVSNYSLMFSQEGLAVRTYASDLFNNWINTETIDGVNGITAVTAVNVVGNKFTIDELNLSKKVYDMLNRIALSDGTYDAWLDANWDHNRQRSAENPMYMGGMIRNLVFQEVVSNAATTEEPLGTLAGRGRLGSVNKGGKIIIKVDEPSYVMGLFSIVPNLDYSQGNKWDVNLKSLNDIHKPALDQIGFQNLITDQMAWWDTLITDAVGTLTFRSAGKQPAWINYTTNVNRTYGNFAIEEQQMYMTLNRRYDMTISGGQTRIADVTTYIDPMKYNHIFADTRLDAQNYQVQIGVDMIVRRKMSGKVIPNL